MTYREQEIEQTVFSSIGDLLRYQKKQQEEYQRGYNDYMKQHRASAYQQGREQAARDLEREKQSQFLKPLFWF